MPDANNYSKGFSKGLVVVVVCLVTFLTINYFLIWFSRHEDNRGRGDSARRRSLSESPKKEVKKERDLPRYSPPPWDDGDVMDQDCDEFVL